MTTILAVTRVLSTPAQTPESGGSHAWQPPPSPALRTLVAQRDARIAAMAGQLSELIEANEILAGKLARLEHLLSRNSKNSSSPPSKDDDPGKTPPQVSERRGGWPKRSRGKQPGAAGANLAWTDTPR